MCLACIQHGPSLKQQHDAAVSEWAANVPCQHIPTLQSPLYSCISTHPPKKLNKSQPESTLLLFFFALPIFNFRCSMPISPIQSPILKAPSSPK
jgi:hypothetical protein